MSEQGEERGGGGGRWPNLQTKTIWKHGPHRGSEPWRTCNLEGASPKLAAGNLIWNLICWWYCLAAQSWEVIVAGWHHESSKSSFIKRWRETWTSTLVWSHHPIDYHDALTQNGLDFPVCRTLSQTDIHPDTDSSGGWAAGTLTWKSIIAQLKGNRTWDPWTRENWSKWNPQAFHKPE